MKTNWMHFELWLDKDYWKDREKNNEYLLHYLADIYSRIYLYADKIFYLFEPNPHLFLAIRLHRQKDYNEVVKIIRRWKWQMPKFVENYKFKKNTKDGNNAEGFIYIMDAITKYNLIYRQKDIELGHLIHCILNNMGLRTDKEKFFYKLMSRIWKI